MIVTRDRDGELRAFHNTCRHRGSQICQPGKGASARLVCPYHRWTYELTANWRTPRACRRDFDRGEHGLVPVTVGGRRRRALRLPGRRSARHRRLPPPVRADARPAPAARTPSSPSRAPWSSGATGSWRWRTPASATTAPPRTPSSPGASRPAPPPTSTTARTAARRRSPPAWPAAGLDVGPVEGDWWQAMRFILNDGFKSMTMDGAFAVKKLMCERRGAATSARCAGRSSRTASPTPPPIRCFMFSAMPVAPNETVVTAKWLVHKDAVEGVDYDVGHLTELWTRTNLQDCDAGGEQPGRASSRPATARAPIRPTPRRWRSASSIGIARTAAGLSGRPTGFSASAMRRRRDG